MAEPTQFAFTFKEIAELMIKKEGIHKGLWALNVRFGIKAANIGPSDDDLRPAAMVPIIEVGLAKVDKTTNLSVDAAAVNPEPKASKRKDKAKPPD